MQNLLKFFFLFLICSSSYIIGNAQVKYQKLFDFPGDDYNSGNSIVQTFDSCFIIAGESGEGGGTNEKLSLVKTNFFGDTLWTIHYIASKALVANSIRQTSDSCYILTGFVGDQQDYDVYLAKVSSLGDTIWTRTFGGINNDGSADVIQVTEGGYLLTGSTTRIGEVRSDILLIRTDSIGDTLWTKTFGGMDEEYSSTVRQTSDSGYVICGITSSFAQTKDIYLIRTNSNGDTLWTRTYGGTNYEGNSCLQQTKDNGFIISGYTLSFGSGDADAYLIKTDANGDTLWTRAYGGFFQDRADFVLETSDSGYIVVGQTNSFGVDDYDIYLFKTDSLGTLLWSWVFGGPGADAGTCVLQTFDLGYVLTGFASKFGAPIYDAFIIKTDPNGITGCNESSAATITSRTQTLVSNPGAIISSGTNITHTNLLSIERGSVDSTICSTINVASLSISSIFEVYPNPASSSFTISNNEKISGMDVFNILGEKLATVLPGAKGQKQEMIFDCRLFPNGIYFVKLQTENGSAVKKLIKQ